MKFNYPSGTTPLEHEELIELIPDHIITQEELNAWEEKNILMAQDWAFKQKEILTLSFIKRLHEYMFDKTWKWAGQFRKSDKNIGINWTQISIKTKELCDDVRYQLDHNTFSKDEVAIRFHHRLVWIHPFPNGNGRHARLMADLLIVQQGGHRFSWGMHQGLYKANPVRKQYIEALQLADRKDYSKLLIFARL
jgi:Fic-DOC domain mobile mystery protein B